MTTSRTKSFLAEIVNGDPIPADKLAYFRARLQDRIYDLVVSEYLQKDAVQKVTRIELAKRIGKDPAQITRYLSSPGNWTLETISDLLLGISAAELEIGIRPLVTADSGSKPRMTISVSSTDNTAREPRPNTLVPA